MSDRYWDSGCFMAFFNKKAGRHEQCQSALYASERGELRVITPALTMTEVIKIKGKPIPPDAEDKIRAFFEHD